MNLNLKIIRAADKRCLLKIFSPPHSHTAELTPGQDQTSKGSAFNDEQTEASIAAVESRPELWDPALKEYGKTRGKMTAWMSVVEETNEHNCSFDVRAVQAKWNNLRDQFTRSRRNAMKKKSGQGTAENIDIKWKRYNRLMFLRPQKNEMQDVSQSNLKLSDDNTCESEISSLDGNNIAIDGKASASTSNTAVTPTPGKRMPRKRRIEEETHSSPQTKTKFMEMFTKAADSVTSMSQQISGQLVQPPDQFTTFGNMVANELRSVHAIAPLGAMQLRIELMSVWSKILSDWMTKQNLVEVIEVPSGVAKIMHDGVPKTLGQEKTVSIDRQLEEMLNQQKN